MRTTTYKFADAGAAEAARLLTPRSKRLPQKTKTLGSRRRHEGGASLQKSRASAESEVHSYPHLTLRAPKHQVFRVLQKGTHSRLARRRHNDAFEDCSVTMSAAIYCTLFKK
jgi:hypothetical protein